MWSGFGELLRFSTKIDQYVDKFDQDLQEGKDRVENIKKIAREIIQYATIVKEEAEEKLDIFKKLKQELKLLYTDVIEAAREIFQKQ